MFPNWYNMMNNQTQNNRCTFIKKLTAITGLTSLTETCPIGLLNLNIKWISSKILILQSYLNNHFSPNTKVVRLSLRVEFLAIHTYILIIVKEKGDLT